MAEHRRIAAAGAALAVLSVTLTATSSAGQDATISVHLEDQIRIAPDDLEVIRKNVDEIFHAAGVVVSWTGPLQRPVSDVSCDGVRHVAVSIINMRKPVSGDARDTDDVLGRAAPPYGRAWVFMNRLVEVAKDRPLDMNLLLARAIAHEIGHLLLPRATAHSAVGIMRPNLEVNHLGAARFTREESKSIRDALSDTRGLAPSGPAGRCRSGR